MSGPNPLFGALGSPGSGRLLWCVLGRAGSAGFWMWLETAPTKQALSRERNRLLYVLDQ